MLRGAGKRERGRTKYVHGITVGIQLEKLILGPLDFPRRLVARKWGRFFGVVIIVGEALHGILSVRPLSFQNGQNQNHQQGALEKGDINGIHNLARVTHNRVTQ